VFLNPPAQPAPHHPATRHGKLAGIFIQGEAATHVRPFPSYDFARVKAICLVSYLNNFK
jgi:hypothetical protein